MLLRARKPSQANGALVHRVFCRKCSFASAVTPGPSRVPLALNRCRSKRSQAEGWFQRIFSLAAKGERPHSPGWRERREPKPLLGLIYRQATDARRPGFSRTGRATPGAAFPVCVELVPKRKRRRRSGTGNFLPVGAERPSTGGSSEGQELAVHHAPPRIPGQTAPARPLSAPRTGRGGGGTAGVAAGIAPTAGLGSGGRMSGSGRANVSGTSSPVLS